MSAAARRLVYNDPRWKRVRALVIDRAHGRCERCGKRARLLDVDHELPIVSAPERAFDATNLRAYCTPCHLIVDLDKRRGYSLDAGADGWPADPRHPVLELSSARDRANRRGIDGD